MNKVTKIEWIIERMLGSSQAGWDKAIALPGIDVDCALLSEAEVVLSGRAVQFAGMAEYLAERSGRCGDEGHAKAIKRAQACRRAMRRALRYSEGKV